MSGPRPLPVTLYRRPGCPLCDHAESVLAAIARELPLAVTSVDIELDDDLLRRYLLEIPVIVADGQELARGRVVPAALREALESLVAT
jgi:glutaredoxin